MMPDDFRWGVEEPFDGNAIYGHEIYHGRHYYLFGILAGVRHDIVEPISEPKGLPDDLSPEVAANARWWDIDGHSHSYFTLEELQAVDWNKYDYDDITDFVEGVLPQMERLGDPQDVRLVFWFDS